MRKLGLGVSVALAALVTLAVVSFAPASEQKSMVKADLTGYLEVPAVSSTGIGTFEGSIDDDAGEIAYTLSYAGLEGPATLFAHIHFGQRSVNGGVSAFLCGGGGKPACPTTEGTVSGTIVASDVIGPSGQGIDAGELGELVTAIRAGRTYANVHTNKHPGGEIRGQINDDNQHDG
jgi:hypothetical protein